MDVIIILFPRATRKKNKNEEQLAQLVVGYT
jgi:hypothetical protein